MIHMQAAVYAPNSSRCRSSGTVACKFYKTGSWASLISTNVNAYGAVGQTFNWGYTEWRTAEGQPQQSNLSRWMRVLKQRIPDNKVEEIR